MPSLTIKRRREPGKARQMTFVFVPAKPKSEPIRLKVRSRKKKLLKKRLRVRKIHSSIYNYPTGWQRFILNPSLTFKEFAANNNKFATGAAAPPYEIKAWWKGVEWARDRWQKYHQLGYAGITPRNE